MAKGTKGKIALGAVIGTTLGAVGGFVAGILTAPKSGKETRTELKVVATEKGKELLDDAAAVKSKVLSKAKTAQSKAVDAVDDVVEEVVGRTEEVKARVGQAVEGAQKGFKNYPSSAKKNVTKK